MGWNHELDTQQREMFGDRKGRSWKLTAPNGGSWKLQTDPFEKGIDTILGSMISIVSFVDILSHIVMVWFWLDVFFLHGGNYRPLFCHILCRMSQVVIYCLHCMLFRFQYIPFSMLLILGLKFLVVNFHCWCFIPKNMKNMLVAKTLMIPISLLFFQVVAAHKFNS